MATGRRCDNGCETWPDSARYARCLICGERAGRYKDMEPLTQEEANRIEFELFYKQWDEDRPASRLAPDAPNAAGRFRSVEGLIAAAQDAPRSHRLSPPG